MYMFFLKLIPESVFHLMFIGGLAGLVISQFVRIIPIAARLGCIVAVLIATYMQGGINVQRDWEAKVAAMQVEMAKREAEAANATVKTVTEYVDKVTVIKEKGDEIIKEVPVYITKESDSKCVIPNSFVMLHDSASKGEVPDSTRPVDETASSTKLSTVGETVFANYTTYYQVAQQLRSLQDWVKTQESIFNKGIK